MSDEQFRDAGDGGAPGREPEGVAVARPAMTETDWWAMSAWAETVEIDPTRPGVLRGAAAAARGRALLRAVLRPGDPGWPA